MPSQERVNQYLDKAPRVWKDKYVWRWSLPHEAIWLGPQDSQRHAAIVDGNLRAEASMKYAVCVIRSSGRFGLMIQKDPKNPTVWDIRGFKSAPEAIAYFEEGYNQAHRRDYSWSMSACLNYIFFEPSIVMMDEADLQTLKYEDMRPARLGNMAGSVDLIMLTKECGEALWNSGEKPNLISEKTFSSHEKGAT